MHRRIVFQQLNDFEGDVRQLQTASASLKDVRFIRFYVAVDIANALPMRYAGM